jgi:hypothetical protein
MKKISVLPIALLIGLGVSGQKLKESEIPATVKESFLRLYPAQTGKWEKEKENYEINFMQAGTATSVVLNEEGKIIETEMEMQVALLLPEIVKYMKDHYKGKKIKEAAKVVNARGTTMYEVGIKKKDLLFDRMGAFIKEVESD